MSKRSSLNSDQRGVVSSARAVKRGGAGALGLGSRRARAHKPLEGRDGLEGAVRRVLEHPRVPLVDAALLAPSTDGVEMMIS